MYEEIFDNYYDNTAFEMNMGSYMGLYFEAIR